MIGQNAECRGQLVDLILQYFPDLGLGSRALRITARRQRRRMDRPWRSFLRSMQHVEIAARGGSARPIGAAFAVVFRQGSGEALLQRNLSHLVLVVLLRIDAQHGYQQDTIHGDFSEARCFTEVTPSVARRFRY